MRVTYKMDNIQNSILKDSCFNAIHLINSRYKKLEIHEIIISCAVAKKSFLHFFVKGTKIYVFLSIN
jgi:hypothetical protein